jgi:hypothetical protein
MLSIIVLCIILKNAKSVLPARVIVLMDIKNKISEFVYVLELYSFGFILYH